MCIIIKFYDSGKATAKLYFDISSKDVKTDVHKKYDRYIDDIRSDGDTDSDLPTLEEWCEEYGGFEFEDIKALALGRLVDSMNAAIRGLVFCQAARFIYAPLLAQSH